MKMYDDQTKQIYDNSIDDDEFWYQMILASNGNSFSFEVEVT
jgi:hypothetical protein